MLVPNIGIVQRGERMQLRAISSLLLTFQRKEREMQILDSTSHVVVRACGVTTKGLDGLYHLTAMGTDAIVQERCVQHLRGIERREEIIKASHLDEDQARSEVAKIYAE